MALSLDRTIVPLDAGERVRIEASLGGLGSGRAAVGTCVLHDLAVHHLVSFLFVNGSKHKD